MCVSCIAYFIIFHTSVKHLCFSFHHHVNKLVPSLYFLTQANEKSGGYINKLVVTCLRSGLNKMFRVLQKPERAPIRALRTSSSGRWISKLYLCYDHLIHYYFSSWIFFFPPLFFVFYTDVLIQSIKALMSMAQKYKQFVQSEWNLVVLWKLEFIWKWTILSSSICVLYATSGILKDVNMFLGVL